METSAKKVRRFTRTEEDKHLKKVDALDVFHSALLEAERTFLNHQYAPARRVNYPKAFKFHSILKKCYDISPSRTFEIICFIRKNITLDDAGIDAWRWFFKKNRTISIHHLSDYLKHGCVSDLLFFLEDDPFYVKYFALAIVRAYLSYDDHDPEIKKVINPHLFYGTITRVKMDIPPYFLAKWAPRESRGRSGRSKFGNKQGKHINLITEAMFISERDVAIKEYVHQITNGSNDLTYYILSFLPKPKKNKIRMKLYRKVISFIGEKEGRPAEYLMSQKRLDEIKTVPKRMLIKHKHMFEKNNMYPEDLLSSGLKCVNMTVKKYLLPTASHIILPDIQERWEKYDKIFLKNAHIMMDTSCFTYPHISKMIHLFLVSGNRMLLTSEGEWLNVEGDLDHNVKTILSSNTSDEHHISRGIVKALHENKSLETFYVLTDRRVHIKELKKVHEILREFKVRVYIINVADNIEHNFMVRTPKKFEGNIFIYSGYSSEVFKILT